MGVLKSHIGKVSWYSIDDAVIFWVHSYNDTIYTQLLPKTELRQSGARTLHINISILT